MSTEQNRVASLRFAQEEWSTNKECEQIRDDVILKLLRLYSSTITTKLSCSFPLWNSE